MRRFEMVPHFQDHPRKRVVREQWDTPVLRWLYERWGAKYLYLGFPGPEAADVKLWANMLRRIVAFEVLAVGTPKPRANIVELGRQLTLLNIVNTVYCGPMEEVLLRREDYDGKPFQLDDFVTLFNLDFCNAITGRVETQLGRRCLRFEALREIVTLQRRLYRSIGANRFVMLVTVVDQFHVNQMRRFLGDTDLPPEVAAYVEAVQDVEPLRGEPIAHNTRLLKAFLFNVLREYFRGQNILSCFLPPVTYFGKSAGSRMIHFAIVCLMEDQETAHPTELQGARDFLRMKLVSAGESGISLHTDFVNEDVEVTDPVAVLSRYPRLAGG